MSAEHEDLPIPSARLRVLGKWGPDTTQSEKFDSVYRATEARIHTLVNIIIAASQRNDTLADAISYLGGAVHTIDVNERLATEIVLDGELLDFLLRLDRYVGERYLVADHEEMHHAAEKYRQLLTQTDPASQKDSAFHASRENLILQVRYYIDYIRNLAVMYPLRQRMAKVLNGIEDPSFVTDVMSDMRSIQGFVALENLLPNPSGKRRTVELEELVELYKEMQMEDLKLTPY